MGVSSTDTVIGQATNAIAALQRQNPEIMNLSVRDRIDQLLGWRGAAGYY
jgi:hypothetical protein